jgi:uncharacterized membrane protein
MSRPRALALAAGFAFAAGFSSLAVLQHRAFTTGRFDVGNLVQAVWSTAHGDVLQTTNLVGSQMSRLGAHFDPVVAAFAPLWWVWPDASLLLVLQAVGVALGAVPVFLLARRHLGSEWAGTGFALAYLLYPPTQWLVLDDFHPVALATPLLLVALWYLDGDRLVPFALAAGAACLTKEHIGLVVAAFGVWYALSRRRRRAGLAIALSGTVVALTATAIVVPHFAPGGGSPFAGRYEGVGGSPSGIARTAVTDPLRIAGAVTDSRDLRYGVALVLPLAGLPLVAPLAAATALPEIAVNTLSSTPTQTSVHFHYTAGAIPGLVFAAVLGAARLARRRPALRELLPRIVVIVTVVAGVAYGPVPVWSHVPGGETLGARDHVVGARARAATRAVELVPARVPVSATNSLGAHLSERGRVFSFPVLGEARWVAVDTVRMSHLDDATGAVAGRRALARLLATGRWRVVFREAGILVLRRS